MSYKHREMAREARLWITQVIVPAIALGASVLSIPNVREAVSEKAKYAKESIQTKIKERKEPK